ncbi:MAG: hypothetical protein FWC41_01835 [Firmicutes bacterium]|nr:hypothetical protein [Bacillota bacterium]
MKNNGENRQQILLDFLNLLEEDNCIITVGKTSDFLPSVFRLGAKYQVYLNQFSQFQDYEDVTDLIDEIISIVCDDDFIEYKIISHDEFYQMRYNQIKNEITKRLKNINAIENNSLKDIITNVERDIATYVLADREIKYLVGAVTTDEDWYYTYLVQKGGDIHLEFSSCVGGYIPLHRYLPAEEYRRLTDYVIEQAISENNIYKTSQWFFNKVVDTTEFAPFTKMSIKQGIFWTPFQFMSSNNNPQCN